MNCIIWVHNYYFRLGTRNDITNHVNHTYCTNLLEPVMKNFIYKKPKTLREASQLLGGSWKEVLPFAGGTDVLGLMKDEIETPQRLVNLKSIPELDKIKYIPGKGLRIGALVTITEIAEHALIKEKYPILAEAAKEVASPQLRNQGTIAGNICQRPRCWYFRGNFDCLRKGGDLCFAVDGENKYHCIIGGGPCYIVHPSDTAVALLALNANVIIFSGKKSFQLPLRDFFVLPEKDVNRENTLKPGDIVTEIQIPDVSTNMRSGFLKFKERGVWDFAVVSVAAVIQKNGNTIESGSVVLGGVAPIPWLEENVNARLTGIAINGNYIEKLVTETLRDAEPLDQNSYKLTLARNLIKRLFTRLSA